MTVSEENNRLYLVRYEGPNLYDNPILYRVEGDKRVKVTGFTADGKGRRTRLYEDVKGEWFATVKNSDEDPYLPYLAYKLEGTVAAPIAVHDTGMIEFYSDSEGGTYIVRISESFYDAQLYKVEGSESHRIYRTVDYTLCDASSGCNTRW